ncbi:MAG: uracil phosphoribosyltransferase, partial [Planctomycetota bacterium]
MPTDRDVVVFDHPLIQHKLTQLRGKGLGHRGFRALLAEIAGLMVFEFSREFPTVPIEVQTPLERTAGARLRGHITLVPVLRAGLAMTEGILAVMPEARVGHLGLARDDSTLEPVTYLNKLPSDLNAGPVVLVDPMLATGGSAVAAIHMLERAGADDLRMICLVASPEGVERMRRECPGVRIYAAAVDRCLNDKGYIRSPASPSPGRMYP